MCEKSFPHTKFKLVHDINDKSAENIEVVILERMGKHILV